MKDRTVKELEKECVSYATFMNELGLTDGEKKKLNKKYKIWRKE